MSAQAREKTCAPAKDEASTPRLVRLRRIYLPLEDLSASGALVRFCRIGQKDFFDMSSRVIFAYTL
jgi:hypothetical protein